MAGSDAGVQVPVDGPLPADALGEVRIHQQLYRARADVAGIVRFQSPKIVSLSTLGRTPLVRHGLGSYFAPQPPFWRDPRLIRDDERASAVAVTLGKARAIVLRGNGAVTVGATLQEACVLAWYLEDAARVEVDALASGQAGAPRHPRLPVDRRIFSERSWHESLPICECPPAETPVEFALVTSLVRTAMDRARKSSSQRSVRSP